MQFIAEFLFEIVFEFVAYGVGRAFLLVLAPRYGVELDVDPGPSKRSWKWRGWSFERGGRRYFYVESVQLVGIAIIIALIVMVATVHASR